MANIIKIEILESGERVITIAGEPTDAHTIEGEELATLLQMPIYDTTRAQLNLQECLDAIVEGLTNTPAN